MHLTHTVQIRNGPRDITQVRKALRAARMTQLSTKNFIFFNDSLMLSLASSLTMSLPPRVCTTLKWTSCLASVAEDYTRCLVFALFKTDRVGIDASCDSTSPIVASAVLAMCRIFGRGVPAIFAGHRRSGVRTSARAVTGAMISKLCHHFYHEVFFASDRILNTLLLRRELQFLDD
jgi:hypothetical protein